MKVPHEENGYRCRCSEPGCDIITSDNIWLFVGREGEDGNPSGENVGEGIHLSDSQLWAQPPNKTEGSTNQGRDVCPLLGIVSVDLVYPGPSNACRCTTERSKV